MKKLYSFHSCEIVPKYWAQCLIHFFFRTVNPVHVLLWWTKSILYLHFLNYYNIEIYLHNKLEKKSVLKFFTVFIIFLNFFSFIIYTVSILQLNRRHLLRRRHYHHRRFLVLKLARKQERLVLISFCTPSFPIWKIHRLKKGSNLMI